MTLIDEVLVVTNLVTLLGWVLTKYKLESTNTKLFLLSREFRRLKKRLAK